MFARQSDLVTSNQNVRARSANAAFGCSATSHRMFHAYCSAKSAAMAAASATTRGRSIDSALPGAEVARSSANPGRSSAIDRWLPKPSAQSAKTGARRAVEGRAFQASRASRLALARSRCSA